MGRRVRPKLAGRTRTAVTQRRRRPGKVTSHGDNASSSGNRIGRRFVPRSLASLAKKVVQPKSLFFSALGQIAVAYGKQTVVNFPIMQKSSLTAMETAANGGTATNNTVRFFLRGGKYRATLRNNTNTNMRVSLYDIVTLRDPPDTTLDSPPEAWAKGLTDFGIATTYETPGLTPWKSPEFRQYYRIHRVTCLHLEPGQQHEHTVIHGWNRIINSQRFQNSVSTSLAGLTRHLMVVVYGSLVHESATPTTVTTASGSLDYSSVQEFSYGFLESTTPSYAITDNYTKTITDPDFMGEDGDVDANIITG